MSDKEYEFHGLQPVLPVSSMQETLDFYSETLGFEIDFISGEPPDHARVSRGDGSTSTVRIRFALVQAGVRVQNSGFIYIHIGRNIDRLFKEYLARNVTVLSDPESHDWGLREFSIRDCNGHILCFAQECHSLD